MSYPSASRPQSANKPTYRRGRLIRRLAALSRTVKGWPGQHSEQGYGRVIPSSVQLASWLQRVRGDREGSSLILTVKTAYSTTFQTRLSWRERAGSCPAGQEPPSDKRRARGAGSVQRGLWRSSFSAWQICIPNAILRWKKSKKSEKRLTCSGRGQ